MRALIMALGTALILSGCVNADDPSTTAAGAVAPASATPAEPTLVDLGEMGFILGPLGNTGVTQTSVGFEGDIPVGTHHVVVVLSFVQGATVDFHLVGIEGCEQHIPGPSQVAGYERSVECEAPAGPFEIVMTHTSGHVEGHLKISGLVAN